MTDHDFLDLLFRRWSRQEELSAEDRRAVGALPWSRRTYVRDGYLVREGEPTSVCSLLVSGFAFRQKLVTDGARQIISFHIPGEFLDLQNCLLECADHNVQCLTRAVVMAVHKNALLDLMNIHPTIRRAIWRDNLVDASIFREWVVNLGRRDARTRIAHLLCEFAARLQTSGVTDGSAHDFPVTQEQIADATGLTAVHTNRTLQALRREGLISLGSSKLTILDWDGLRDVGDFSERYLHNAT